MLRLIIETSNLDFQIGIHDGTRLVYRSDHAGEGGPTELTEMLAAGLAQAETSMSAIGEIVVDLGPGGLTSTRSGIAFANGLAFARDIKIVGANSLELMVMQVAPDPQSHVVAARRSNDGNYFLGLYQGGACHRLALGKPEALIEELGWQSHELTWIGPHPKQWAEDPPAMSIQFNDLLSPGLDAFDVLIQQPDFDERARVDAAGPMNELIR